MCVVPVKLQHKESGKTIETFALLDSCSQGTFVLEKVVNNLGVKGRQTSITIKTINGEITNKTTLVKGLKVRSNLDDSKDWLELPDTYTKKYLPVDRDDIATPSKLQKWKHLEGIIDKIAKDDKISVGLLIGANCTKALEPIDIIPSKNNGPYAFRTKLGWCIVGPVNGSNCRKEMKCHKIAVKQAPSDNIADHYFQTKADIKESEVSEMLTRMYNQEFSETGIGKKNREDVTRG